MNNPMFPMNDPLRAMVSIAKSGGNPLKMVQQMAGNDPQIIQFMQMVKGKNSTQLEQIARNMAKKSGVSIESIINQLGI